MPIYLTVSAYFETVAGQFPRTLQSIYIKPVRRAISEERTLGRGFSCREVRADGLTRRHVSPELFVECGARPYSRYTREAATTRATRENFPVLRV